MCFTFSSQTKRRSCSDESKLSRSETQTAATSQQWLIFCISHSVTTSRHTVEVRRRLNFSTQNQKRHRVIFETITSPEGFPPPLSFPYKCLLQKVTSVWHHSEVVQTGWIHSYRQRLCKCPHLWFLFWWQTGFLSFVLLPISASLFL